MSYYCPRASMDKKQKIFSKIYDEYIEKIYRFVFLKVGSKEVTQDLCSETFLRAWNVFKANPKKIKNQQAFLYKIARNLIVDYYRNKSRTETIPIESVPIVDLRANFEKNILISSDLEEIKSALSNIKSEYQEVIIWYYVDELSVPEIAQILNKPEGTVRVTIHRALNAIRDQIQES